MRVVHWMSTRNYEILLAEAIAEGARKHGDVYETRLISEWNAGCDTGDLMVLVGLHAARKPLAEDSAELGRRVLHVDKGIVRTSAVKPGDVKTEYWRVSLDNHQPGFLLGRMSRCPSDRRERFGWIPQPTTYRGAGHALICPPGRRECLWYGIGDHVTVADRLARTAARTYPGAPLLFRPKPRHVDQAQWETPPVGCTWDDVKRPIEASLREARAMFAHYTSATLNAVLAGVPVHLSGLNVATPVCIPHGDPVPRHHGKLVELWLNRVAYLQWSWDEFRSGAAWDVIKNQLMRCL